MNNNHFYINPLILKKMKKSCHLIELEGKQKTKNDIIIKKFSLLKLRIK